jgi:hypothetical protein
VSDIKDVTPTTISSLLCEAKNRQNPPIVKYWEVIASRFMKAGWSLGWVSAVDSEERTIWVVDAHRGDGKRFIVYADNKPSAFIELERQVLTVTFYLESVHTATPQLSSFHCSAQRLSGSGRRMNPQCNETPNEAMQQTPALQKVFSIL